MSRPIKIALKNNFYKMLRENRLDQAEEIIHAIQKHDPLSAQTKGMELELLVKAERWAEASRLCEQLMKLYPDSSRIMFLAGKLAYRLKDYPTSAEHFRESHRLYAHWRSQYWLGKALTQKGDFEEALLMLEAVKDRAAYVLPDLAWLFERMGEIQQAVSVLEQYLSDHEDSRAQTQLTRLRAKQMSPDQLGEEFATMMEFEDAVPDTLVTEFLANLLKTGQVVEARRYLDQHPTHPPNISMQIAWQCYHYQQYDVALDRFLPGLERNIRNPKYLNALEYAARMCHRADMLNEHYSKLAPRYPQLYGRAKRLARS